jgi:hypothetical protein
MDKRAVDARIMKRKRCLKMRPRWSEPARVHQGSTGGHVTQNEPGRIFALAAQIQQILVQAPRQIEFAANRVVARLPIGNPKEFRWKTEPLPQLLCAGKGMARFRSRLTFDRKQRRAEGAPKFELLSPPLGPTGQ